MMARFAVAARISNGTTSADFLLQCRKMENDVDSKDVETTARRLAKGHGYSDSFEYRLGNGFVIPRWVTFISRAEQIEQEREARK